MLRWGLDWLIKAHPEENTLVVQVGDGTLALCECLHSVNSWYSIFR